MDSTLSADSPADIWRERIAAQRASGQPIRVWCRDKGCREHSFYHWRVRLNLSPVTAEARRRRRASSAKPMKFTELTALSAATEPASGVEPIRLRLARGRELLLPTSMPAEQIAELVGLIEGLPEPGDLRRGT